MRYLPIFLDVQNKRCALIGGGEIAARKLAWLQAAGASVRIVAPQLDAEVAAKINGDTVQYVAETFRPEHVDGCLLVVAATDNAAVNIAVADAARARHLPVNVVDDPARCSFIVPAIIDREPMTIAVSSSGTSPVLARWVRSRIESLIPSSIGRLAAFFGARRQHVEAQLPEIGSRRRFWEQLLNTDIPFAISQGRERDADTYFEQALNEQANAPKTGKVYLIGAGPGDPDLLTFRALQRLQQADVVVYDRLVAPAIVELARRDATRMYVGKCRDAHSVPQEEISQRLVELAQAGKIVARLKGGDPFIFGRGGEEIQALAAAGLPYEVVPGITAASGCAAYAGIPLTHRDYAQSVRFITGHTKDGILNLDWAHLAASTDTMVFYMGLGASQEICAQLITHGLPADHPAGLIEHGTTARQRVYTGTLATLPDLIRRAQSPALLIVGEVVNLHESLAWFEGSAEASAAFTPPVVKSDAATLRSAA
ncbi:MAG TPA: siroheme synthase CysG [Halothiobacillus sp.]|nr:MAG: uroporphyrinogen-III C-methyltransferase [Halothiobacillus sp. 20-54-6]HQT43253.1 siroheme synthase CysG [Halothiobacillus sp.]